MSHFFIHLSFLKSWAFTDNHLTRTWWRVKWGLTLSERQSSIVRYCRNEQVSSKNHERFKPSTIVVTCQRRKLLSSNLKLIDLVNIYRVTDERSEKFSFSRWTTAEDKIKIDITIRKYRNTMISETWEKIERKQKYYY